MEITAEQILSAEDVYTDEYANSLSTFSDEKIFSVMSARLFNDPSLFTSSIRISSNMFDVADDWGEEGEEVTEDDLNDLLFESTLTRYILCDYTSLYEKLREMFAKALGEDMLELVVYSETLVNYCSLEKYSSDAYKLFLKENQDLVCNFLEEQKTDNDEMIAAELNKAFPKLQEFLSYYVEYDPELELTNLRLWFYRSETLGRFLTENPSGHDADRLRDAVDGPSLFMNKAVSDGVFYAFECIGSSDICYEDRMPVTTLSIHDIARIRIIMELLPKFDKKGGE
jgi:hypothetical protein